MARPPNGVLSTRTVDVPRRRGLYTVGYEDLRIEQFVAKLRELEIQTVIDVRLNASSRRPGYSRRALERVLSRVGIGYEHLRELGNPPENRAAFRNGSLEEGRRLMRARLANGGAESLQRLVRRGRNERVAVLCVERFDVSCHRQVIIEMAKELDPALYATAVW
jgi:uncharacterized protein (DUF488 family)